MDSGCTALDVGCRPQSPAPPAVSHDCYHAFMTQVTWRAPGELVERVRQVASRRGWSLNEYLTRLAQAATDPALAGNDFDRLRERLALAGLLVEAEQRRARPDRDAVTRARRAAGEGTPLSRLVVRDRG